MTIKIPFPEKTGMPHYETIRKGDFHLTVKKGLDLSWLDIFLRGLGNLPPSGSSKSRRRCFLEMPQGFEYPVTFVKTYSHTDEKHESLRRKNFFRRLLPRYAAKEGKAYLTFEKSGLKVPGMVLFGEQWRFGIRSLGVVMVEAVQGPSVQQVIRETRDAAFMEKAFESLAEIHAAGVSHGDAHLVNFIYDNHGIIPVDIESSKPLTPKRQKTDLINIMVSLLIELSDTSKLEQGIDFYKSFNLSLPGQKNDLINQAVIKAEKIRKSRTRAARFNFSPPAVLSLNELL